MGPSSQLPFGKRRNSLCSDDAGGRYERFLVDEDFVMNVVKDLDGTLLDPLKTTRGARRGR